MIGIQMIHVTIQVASKEIKEVMVLLIPIDVYVWLGIYARMNTKPYFGGFYKVHKINLIYSL